MSDKVIFNNDHDVDVDTLNYLEEQRVGELDKRLSTAEVAGSAGILTGLALSNPTPYNGAVGAGVAYNDLGNTLRVVTGDSFSNRAAPLTFTFTGGDVGKLITLSHATTDDDPEDNPVTGAPEATRQQDYPVVHLRTSAAAHEVVIGSITAVDGSGNASFSTALAQYWGARLTPQQILDIQNALFEVTSHQQEDHASGIEAIGPGGDPGAITVDGGPTPDKATVTNTVSKDSILINGVRLSGAGKFSNLDVTFIDGAVTANPQLWAIQVNSAGVVGKTLAAQYGSPQVITGLQLVDLCPFGIPYPSSLTIDQWKVGSVHFIRIHGNATISVTSSGLYLLRTDTDPDTAVLVYVTVGDLPSGGSDGSPHQDVITTHPEIYDVTPGWPAEFGIDNPPVTIADADGNSGCLFLGYLWWYGTALNLLGYGTWATTGVAYDKRNKGTLTSGQLSTAYRNRLVRDVTDFRADGFAGPPQIFTSGGTLNVIIVRSDARTDIDDSEKSAYAYIGGRRLRVQLAATFALPTNATSCVYLEDQGDGTALWGHQTGAGTIGIPLSATKMPVWNVTTDGTGTTLMVDVSVTLPRVDREVVRMNRRNTGDFELDGDVTFRKQTTEGEGIVDTDAHAQLARRVVAIAPTAIDVRTAVDETVVSGASNVARGWVEYANNADDDTPERELVLNAYWGVDGNWHRRLTGKDSAILRLAHDGGIVWAIRKSGSADTWTDTYDAAGWDRTILSALADYPLLSSGAAKAGTVFHCTSGTVTVDRQFNVSTDPAVTGTGATSYFLVTFDVPMPTNKYAVVATAWSPGGGGSAAVYFAFPVAKNTGNLHLGIMDDASARLHLDTFADTLYVDLNILHY